VEANAITPERMRRIGRLGPRVVDGSILAASGISLYLAGEESEAVARLFESTDVKAIPLDGEPARPAEDGLRGGTRSGSR
jgi:hypothetical protein